MRVFPGFKHKKEPGRPTMGERLAQQRRPSQHAGGFMSPRPYEPGGWERAQREAEEMDRQQAKEKDRDSS